MCSHDYRTRKKAKRKNNFIRVNLVKNLNWASETSTTTPNKIYFLLIFSNVFAVKKKLKKVL